MKRTRWVWLPQERVFLGRLPCPESPPVFLGFRDHSDEGCGIFHGVEVLGILIFLTVLSFGSQEAS